MGAKLVNALYDNRPDLHLRAFSLLVGMAGRAMDSNPRPEIWVGQETLCHWMGSEPSPGNLRNLRRVLEELIDAGLIERTQTGGVGPKGTRRSRYLLKIDRATEGRQDPPKAGRQDPPKAGRQDPPKAGRQDPPKAGRQDPPKAGRQGPPEEQSQGTTLRNNTKEHRVETQFQTVAYVPADSLADWA